jgi:alkanesulfonate monooxygenase SsuD/methylene tetrahydromethanopterin reductase-like flavin-dependent oxidoreductase (luciferase family)
MACVNAVVADSNQEAEHLSTSLKQLFIGVITGKRQLLQPPVTNMDAIWNEMEEEAVYQMLAVSFIGGKEKVRADLQSFLNQTQVDEVMVTSHIYDHQARLQSYKLFAEVLREA